MFSERFVVAVLRNCGGDVDFGQKKVKLSWRGKWEFGGGKASALLHLQKIFYKGEL